MKICHISFLHFTVLSPYKTVFITCFCCWIKESFFCRASRQVSQRAAALFLLKSVQPRLGGFKYFDTGLFNLNRLVYVLASAEGIIQEESLCPNCMCFLSRQPGTGIFPNCTQGSCVASENSYPTAPPTCD